MSHPNSWTCILAVGHSHQDSKPKPANVPRADGLSWWLGWHAVLQMVPVLQVLLLL